jgi:hypothetical protein
MRTRSFLPRPEYPRPDRQRGFLQGVDWINLNGAWEFRFDPDDCGREKRWFDSDEQQWRDQIIVPFCWESLAAWGEGDAAGNDHFYSTRVYRNPLEVTSQNYRGAARFEIGWYRRAIEIPANDKWNNKRVILTIGAADFYTEAWCNGQLLGTHEGGFTPFEFDLTDTLRRNKGQLAATIVIRVEDRMENYQQPVGKQWGWYSSASGIWQTVFVEPRAPQFIERFQITSDIERATANFRIFCAGGSEVLIHVTNPAGEQFTASALVKEGVAEAELNVGKPMLWDTTLPQLYSVRFQLYGGDNEDVVHGYFGMRSLSAESVKGSTAPGSLCLNGEAIYLRGALYQSYYPDGIYTAGDTQILRDDIAYAKRVGFDLLRVHIKVDDPMLLYYADTVGILLMCDFPNFGEGGDTECGRAHYEATMRGAIARDFNHPSIVAWCLFNETWGFGGQAEFMKLINTMPPISGAPIKTRDKKLSNENAYEWIQQMWQLAKSLDATRMVEDMSVVAWEHLQYYGHGETDINSWHFYTSDYPTARRWINEVVEQTYTGSSFNYVPGFQQKAQPLVASEYGGVAALDGDLDTSWSFKFLTNELRRHGQLSAYIYTELHDVEWERNGFLNYDRTPKDFGYDPNIVNGGDVLPIDSPPIRCCVPGEEIAVDIFSSHFSRIRKSEVLLQWRVGGIDSLGWMHDCIVAGEQPIAFPHLRVELAKRLTFRLPQQTMLCTLWVRALVPDGKQVASNYVQFFVDGGHPAWQQMNSRTVLRLDAHSWSRSEWNRRSSTREQANSAGAAYGETRGFFEYKFPVPPELLHSCSRLTVLCEASSLRDGAPQTDRYVQPSTLRLLLNGVPVYHAILPNHPHDARGSLTYLRGGRGGYGYLCHATIECELLDQVVKSSRGTHLRLRFLMPRDEQPQGGLSIYGCNAGRYPLGPTLIID